MIWIFYALLVTFVRPAFAANGQVIVYVTDVAPVKVHENPSDGCYRLPQDLHLLVNQTDQQVRVFNDPTCISPGATTIQPGFGAHVDSTARSFTMG